MWKADASNIVTPEAIEAEKREQLRAERNRLLRESDWTQLPDSPADKERWAIYRQQLRDMTYAVPDAA